MKKEIVYKYRGNVERRSDYHWMPGYSQTMPDGSILYPWMTKRECQKDAKSQGAKAIFTN